MAKVEAVFYRDEDGRIPLVEWFNTLSSRGLAKCRAKIERLSRWGQELREPDSDYLRDGIYGLRVGLEGTNYRMLYFFYERTAVIINTRIIKESTVSLKEMDIDVDQKRKFEENPYGHTYQEMQEGGKPISDGVEILHKLFFEGKPQLIAWLEEERANTEIAQKIFMLRKQAGLSQRPLAQLAGINSSVIVRLENADYEGHGLAMLRRIAAALNKRVEFRFVDLRFATRVRRAKRLSVLRLFAKRTALLLDNILSQYTK